MGATCSCFGVDDFEGQSASISLHLLTAQFLHVCSTLFNRREAHAIPPSASIAMQVSDNSACDTFRCPPPPLAYDDPRCSPVQRLGLISRHGKASCHCHEEPCVLRSTKGGGAYSIVTGEKFNMIGNNEEDGLQFPESSVKQSPEEFMTDVTYTFTSSEDEDSCPICLEEYTPENPCITMQCSHDFHLGCIYEWMERSDACPICGKVMVFDEAA